MEEQPVKKNKVGRPGQTLEGLNKACAKQLQATGCKDWKELIQFEMSQGASITEIRAFLGLWDKNYGRFRKEYPEFDIAIKKGRAYSKAWWIRTGRENLSAKEFNSTLWYMNMKNRFDWKDKTEIKHNINGVTEFINDLKAK